MVRGRDLLVLLLGLLAGPAAAQGIVRSPAPDQVAVTVYRDPDRPPMQPISLAWPSGYALISETRTVSVPAGETEIRFEGVAAGILPQSVIVNGFPEGVVERNRDAYLLSPGTLLDRSLGRRVHLRRTSLATGAVREQEAIIRTGADGALVLETAEGFEALRCTGLPETLIYDEIPQGLSARPTLSVRVRSGTPLTTSITLSYLAQGLDWQANYIAQLAPDGRRLDLFAWLTLVNGDETGFADASTQAVAGRLNREAVAPPPSESGPILLQCWPQGTTSDVGAAGYDMPPPPPPAPPPPPMAAMVADEAIMVTGSRVRAELEALGDLKLYRIPEPVTVAARSQKQVTLLERTDVRVDIVHRHDFDATDGFEDEAVPRLLVTRNRTAEGLGLPLPAGRLVLFANAGDRPILIGEGYLPDRAVGEDVEVAIGSAAGVRHSLRRIGGGKGPLGDYELTITNDGARPVRYEARLGTGGVRIESRTRLARRGEQRVWQASVPANGTATLRYRVEQD